MRKWLLRFSVFAGILGALFVIARLTNALQFYRSPSTANAPTIGLDELFFSTNLAKPKRFDFVCFQTETKEMGKYTAVYRLCGLPGDRVELRAGGLYVNGAFADSSFHLLRPYRLAAGDYIEGLAEKGLEPQPVGPDSVEVMLDPAAVVAKGLKAMKQTALPDYNVDAIASLWGQHWTMNDFGPVTVPANEYFILGDNRWGANDSRFLGFIKKEAVVGRVIGK